MLDPVLPADLDLPEDPVLLPAVLPVLMEKWPVLLGWLSSPRWLKLPRLPMLPRLLLPMDTTLKCPPHPLSLSLPPCL